MVRAKKSTKRIARKKRIMKDARGQRGGRSKLYRTAKESLLKKQAHATAGRRRRRRDFRRLWIIRINAAARRCGMSYSVLMAGLKKNGVEIDRKMLAEMAVSDMAAFTQLANRVQAG